MTDLRLILASGSVQRRQLMADAGYTFQVVVPGKQAECGICSTSGPAGMVAELAGRKAADVVAQLHGRTEMLDRPHVVIACDTMAECGGAILGKPSDEAHARAMLQQLSGTEHRVYSGICVWPLPSDEPPLTKVDVSVLRMDPISAADVDDYLASGLWQGKAGAFGIQDRPGWLHLVSGSESNVIGMPMELLDEMLAALV